MVECSHQWLAVEEILHNVQVSLSSRLSLEVVKDKQPMPRTGVDEANLQSHHGNLGGQMRVRLYIPSREKLALKVLLLREANWPRSSLPLGRLVVMARLIHVLTFMYSCSFSYKKYGGCSKSFFVLSFD